MIQLRHRQPSLWHSGLAKDIEDLWEPWMKEVDQLLEDAALQTGRATEIETSKQNQMASTNE